MKTLIIYDSLYGNTRQIANAMFQALPSSETKIKSASEVELKDLESVGLLLIGSPTHGGRPKASLLAFLESIPNGSLKGVTAAAFDTRFLIQDQGFALRLLMKTIGYAASRIADVLKVKGAEIIVLPEGFIVEGKKGPLKAGETARAGLWAGNFNGK